MTVVTETEIQGLKQDIATIDTVVEGNQSTTVTKDGKTILTLKGRLDELGYRPPVAYAGAIAFGTTDSTKTIERGGFVYAPRVSSLPFTTSGTWAGDDENKFYLVYKNTDNSRVFPLAFADNASPGTGLSGTDVGAFFGITLSAGDVIETEHFDSARTAGSGAKLQATGITAAGKAGNTPDADGYFYDAAGAQFEPADPVPSGKVYGALGDGATDDTAAINSALALRSACYLPAGTYAISSALRISSDAVSGSAGSLFYGDGPKLTILKQTDNDADAVVVKHSDETRQFAMRPIIRGIGIEYSGALLSNTGAALRLRQCINATVEDITIDGATYGVVSERSVQCWYSRVYFRTALRASGELADAFFTFTDDPFLTLGTSFGNFVSNCESQTGQGVQSTFNLKAVDGLYVSNSHFDYAERHFFINPDTTGGQTTVRQVQVSNTYLDNNAAVPLEYVIFVRSDGAGSASIFGLQFSNCAIRGLAATTTLLRTDETLAGFSGVSTFRRVSFSGCDLRTLLRGVNTSLDASYSPQALIEDISFTGCTITDENATDNPSWALVRGTNFTFTGCTFNGNWTESGGSPFSIADCDNITIVSNVFNTSRVNNVVYASGSVTGLLVAANVNQADNPGAKNNPFATGAPTVNDDENDDYSVGSVWTDTTNDRAYFCVDASAGAAVWKEFALQGSSPSFGNVTAGGVDISSGLPVLELHETDAPTSHSKAWVLLNAGNFNIQTRNSAGGFVANDYITNRGAAGATAHKWSIGADEALQIDGSRRLLIGKSSYDAGATAGIELTGDGRSYHVFNSGTIQILNRIGSDGELMQFRHAGVNEGSVSVSGTTVSYNGAHLSRWSQWECAKVADSETKGRPEVLRGTILSNVDEMCEWFAIEWEEVTPAEIEEVVHYKKKEVKKKSALYDFVDGKAVRTVEETTTLEDDYEAFPIYENGAPVIENGEPQYCKKKIIDRIEEMVLVPEKRAKQRAPYDGHGAPGDVIDHTTETGDIVKATILKEANEQLNRMKVSDVAGDPSVSGVFQGYDFDDNTAPYDFYCAMTGDFVVRISKDVKPADLKGALIESAGDGTGRPQSDDLVRASTVAKVTSTKIVKTYPDGSYVVPCVLMAC